MVDRLGVAGNHRNRAVWAHLLEEHVGDTHPNVKVYWTIDAARWKQTLYTALR